MYFNRTERAIYLALISLSETEYYDKWVNILYDKEGVRILSNWKQETLFEIQNELQLR